MIWMAKTPETPPGSDGLQICCVAQSACDPVQRVCNQWLFFGLK